ncbi:MAG: branched-chain amino acid ABC transporter permease [Thermoanaerobaculia bacterium]
MVSQQVLNALGIGCTYALVSLGYSLTFGTLRVVNVAYGEVFMFSAMAAVGANAVLPHPTIVVASALLTAVLLGLGVHLLAVRPLGRVSDVNAPAHLSVVVSTMGCSIVLQNTALALFGGYPRPFPHIFSSKAAVLASGLVTNFGVLVGGVLALALTAALAILLRRMPLGLEMRAIAENPTLAGLSGISVPRIELMTVAISSLLAGAGALLVGEIVGTISPFIGLQYGMKSIVIIVVGGARNPIGTVMVAFALAGAEVLAVALGFSTYRDGIAFLLLLLVGAGRSVRARRSE